MKFSCYQNDLIEGIITVQKAVSSKTNMDILKGILLETKNNKILLTGNDLNLAISIEIEAQVVEEGAAVLDSRLLGDIVRKLPDAAIDFTMNDRQMDIRCLHSNFKLMSFDPDEFPQLPLIENPEEMKLNKEVFKNMIRQTLFSVSTDETRPILTGALLEISEDRISMVAIDGYRLAMKSIDHEGKASSKTVIPGKTLSELLKILSATGGEEMNISITDKYIAFEINHIKIISKILEGEFIKYEQIIPSDFKTQLKINTVELLQAIERASLMTRESKSGTVKISFDSEYVEVSSISEIGSVSDKVRVKTEGDIFEIGFNPRYLTEALRVIDAEEVLIKMSSSLSPCIIKPSDNDQYTYLVLPVRMSN